MIEVLKSGLYSSIQDGGRFGYRDIGVPVSGAMDLQAFELANTLLNNDLNASVLEMTMIGAKLKFHTSIQIVITGADMSPKINSVSIKNNKVFQVNKDDILDFGQLKSGLRCYLAIKGGFASEEVLRSQSFYEPITASNVINNGAILNVYSLDVSSGFQSKHSKLKARNYSDSIIKVFKGAEFDLLSEVEKKQLLASTFKVSSLYNRMAYQIQPAIKHNLVSILSSPVLPGTVQLTPSGQLIILMRDCQTTGGYPRVLQLSEASINLLSQKKERDEIRFELINF